MAEIRNDKKFNIGDEVHWIDQYGTMRWGIVCNVSKEKTQKRTIDFVRIYHEGRKGDVVGAKMERCWSTRQECIDAENRRVLAQKKEYMKDIVTIEDLVYFLYAHDMMSEHKDYGAEAAAVAKAKDLLGIDIEHDNKFLSY